jgi:hypothetical protein
MRKMLITAEDTFSILRDEIKTFHVVFEGEYAGVWEKQDRLLPELTIEVL